MIGYMPCQWEYIWEASCTHHLHSHASAGTSEDLVSKPITNVGGRAKCREEARADGSEGCAKDRVWNNEARSRD